MTHFRAPWSRKLKLLTAAFGFICLLIMFGTGPAGSWAALALVGLCAVFTVRGSTIVGRTLHIHRLGWATTYDLARVEKVEYNPGVTMGSIRTWGIGGVMGFVGYFRNSLLGSYKAYLTDDANAVFLDFGDEKIVVSPERPAEFVEAVRAAR